MKQRINLH